MRNVSPLCLSASPIFLYIEHFESSSISVEMVDSHFYRLYLPFELGEAIVEEAWLGCADSNSRWSLYRALRSVNRMWCDIAVIVCLRHVILECRMDVLWYRKITEKHRAPLLPGQSQSRYSANAWDGPSHLRFVMAEDFRKDLFVDWSDYFTGLHSLVPRCLSAQILIIEGGLHPNHDKWTALFKFLSKLGSLESLRLIWPRPIVPTLYNAYFPNIAITSVKRLFLSRSPHRCGCIGPERQWCLSRNLFAQFPDVVHLHLESPCFLKGLCPHPPSLEVVTLEAPPTQSITGREPFSSIMGYNVAAALNNGFLRQPETTLPQRRIVVNTGPVLPLGWRQAQEACELHGIALHQNCVHTRIFLPHKEERYPPIDLICNFDGSDRFTW